MKKTKGQMKKEHILNVCRELFHENGYKGTSARMISKAAQINLGLVNYYFDGKAEIGQTVYYDIRRAFMVLISDNEPDLSEMDLFLFSSALELQLCVSNHNYGKFFTEIVEDNVVHERLLKRITSIFSEYALHNQGNTHSQLAAISLTAMKPSLVKNALATSHISTEAYVQYYIKQQLHYLGRDESESDYYWDLLNKYHIDIAFNLTPIMVKIK